MKVRQGFSPLAAMPGDGRDLSQNCTWSQVGMCDADPLAAGHCTYVCCRVSAVEGTPSVDNVSWGFCELWGTGGEFIPCMSPVVELSVLNVGVS